MIIPFTFVKREEQSVPKITFNAFSFLQKKLKQKNIAYSNVTMNLAEGTRVSDLIVGLGLVPSDVEVVFINGRVSSTNTRIADQDRVALVPHGTPGPYRVLLGFKNKQPGIAPGQNNLI